MSEIIGHIVDLDVNYFGWMGDCNLRFSVVAFERLVQAALNALNYSIQLFLNHIGSTCMGRGYCRTNIFAVEFICCLLVHSCQI